MANQSEGNSMDCQGIWRHLLIFCSEKLCCNCNTNIAIAIAMLTLQLQLQQNAIESYIAIEIYVTNTRIFVPASMGSQLAQW